MIDSKYRISLDIHSTISNVRLKCKRGDTSRIICTTLTENGFPYHISEDCYAAFTATKPDGNVVFNKCKINDNVIEYEFTPQTAAVSGVMKCEIKLYGADDKLITSPSFILVVSDTAYDEGDEIESEKEVDALTHLISESFKAIKKADIALGQAEQAIEAAQKIDDVKDIADEAQSAADQALEIAETVEQHVQRIEDDQQDMKDDVDRKLTAPSGAKVGQYLQITEVDAEGRVIKVEPVDALSGGYGGGDLDMKGSMIDNIGTLAFAGPDGTAANGAWMAIDDVVESDNGVVSPVINHLSNDHDHPVIYRNIAPGVEDRDAANVGQLKTKLPAPPKAAIGQFLRVTAVDENGAVTAVEAVDAPSGGGGSTGVYVGEEEPTDDNVMVWIPPGGGSLAVVAPDTAEVGQTIVVEEVAENGLPTKWKAVDLPAGGSGGDKWETVIDYTVPEDCTQAFLKTDLNGNPFKLKEAIVTFLLLPVPDVTAAAAVRYTVDGSITNTVYNVEHYAHGAPTTPTAAGKCTVFKIHVLDTPFGVHLIEAAQAKDANYSEKSPLGVRPVDVYDPFNSSTLMQRVTEISGAGVGGIGAAIGAGSRIIMVGVRE
jgi:hypothetical protein